MVYSLKLWQGEGSPWALSDKGLLLVSGGGSLHSLLPQGTTNMGALFINKSPLSYLKINHLDKGAIGLFHHFSSYQCPTQLESTSRLRLWKRVK
jgi:hypothetical protein